MSLKTMSLKATSRKTTSLILSLLLVSFSRVSFTAHAADWPQFRGPQANGVSAEQNLPDTWSADENVRWQVDVEGTGWSAPVVADGKVILTTVVPTDQEVALEEEPAEESAEGANEGRGGRRRRDNRPNRVHRFEVHCYDLNTGDLLWNRVAREAVPTVPTHNDNTYASETPVTDGERIIAYFGMNGVYCYDFEGNLVWEKDLGAYPMQNGWGTSSSPAMVDGLVFIQVDNEEQSFLVALDAKTGDQRRRVERDERSNWGSPIIWHNSKQTELIVSGKVVRSYDPATGNLIWELDMGGGTSSSTPAATGDLLLFGGQSRGRDGGAGGLFAVKAGASGDISPGADGQLGPSIAWLNPDAAPSMASPLLYEGNVYVLGRRGGILACLDAETGETRYQERLPDSKAFWASPWACGGKIFCQDDTGGTHVVAPGAELNILHTNQLEGRFWATTAIADGALLLRSENKLFCVAKAN